MTPSARMPEALRIFCSNLARKLEKHSDPDTRMHKIEEAFPELLAHRSLFLELLRNIVKGEGYPDIREGTLFDNEILLYVDENRLFSLRLYLWGPGECTFIHDHSAWGLMGAVSGELAVTNYRREDDGSREDQALLSISTKGLLSPGQFERVHPLNEGIHKTGNPSDKTMVTVHLYGTPLRRPYINRYDLKTGRVFRMVGPKRRKRTLARQALEDFSR